MELVSFPVFNLQKEISMERRTKLSANATPFSLESPEFSSEFSSAAVAAHLAWAAPPAAADGRQSERG